MQNHEAMGKRVRKTTPGNILELSKCKPENPHAADMELSSSKQVGVQMLHSHSARSVLTHVHITLRMPQQGGLVVTVCLSLGLSDFIISWFKDIKKVIFSLKDLVKLREK